MLYYSLLGSLFFFCQPTQPATQFVLIKGGQHLQITTSGGASTQIDLSSQLFAPSEVLDVFITTSGAENYALLSVGFPSKGDQATSGFCAAGYEEQWVWLAYSPDLSQIKPQVFAGGSCLRGIYPDLAQDGHSVATLSGLSSSFEEIRITTETEDDTSAYRWSADHIGDGFHLVQ